jgi:glycosyltransferase involved in cell wall biosynthesis
MEYALRQAVALTHVAGVKLVFVCRPTFPRERLPSGIRIELLPAVPTRISGGRAGVLSKASRATVMVRDLRRVAKRVVDLAEKEMTYPQSASQRDRKGRCSEVRVLFACYQEYFAPFWVGPLRQLAKRGVAIGTIAHDPVRNFVVGPLWWHRWSVRLGYSFVRHVFVHDDTAIDFGGTRPSGIEVHQIPHGPYEIADPRLGRNAVRQRYGFNDDGRDIVFLAFGQIRDGKNLDLFLRAMTNLPSKIKLLVAGDGVSGSSKPPAFYQDLALKLGVSDRCVWDIRRILDEEVGDVFAACDAVLLTYGAQFRSASGVLSAAVCARKPVLASSGPGPLKSAVREYALGVWIEPDSETAILGGIDLWESSPPEPRWLDYTQDHSWAKNAELVFNALKQKQ